MDAVYENPSIGTSKFNTRAKSFYPWSNLNARAHFFLPRNYTNMPVDVFKPTERLRHSSIPNNVIYFSTFDLNTCAKAFAPKCKKTRRGWCYWNVYFYSSYFVYFNYYGSYK